MHVLHRPHHLQRAAVAAAVLAIVLTLVIAGGLNDLSSAPTPTGTPPPRAAVYASAVSSPAGNPFTHRPFTRIFTEPVRLPWASAAH